MSIFLLFFFSVGNTLTYRNYSQDFYRVASTLRKHRKQINPQFVLAFHSIGSLQNTSTVGEILIIRAINSLV